MRQKGALRSPVCQLQNERLIRATARSVNRVFQQQLFDAGKQKAIDGLLVSAREALGR